MFERMRAITLKYYYNVSDLESYYRLTHTVTSEEILERKKSTKILIIDDNKQPIEQNLKSLGYNIERKEKIASLDEINRHVDIFIVDIMNVGTNFSEESEGAFLAAEIKKMNPMKPVFVFTGAAHDGKYNKYLRGLDGTFAKNSVEELIEQIENYVKNRISPVLKWKGYRKDLLNKGVSLNDLLYLEHYYVKSYMKKKPIILENAINKKKDLLFSDKDEVKLLIKAILKSTTKFMVQK